MHIRTLLSNLAKFSIVAGLLVWMMQSGRLNLRELRIFIDKPEITLLSLALWLVGPTLLGSLRWKMLLNGAGFNTSWPRALVLQVIGFFFSSAMPGSVGGDVVKAVYIVKDHPDQSKTNAMMTVFLDRIIGMCGLFLMGYCVLVLTGIKLLSVPAIKTQFMLMSLVTAAILLFLVTMMYPHRSGRDPFLRILEINFPGAGALRKIYLAFRSFHDKKTSIVLCCLISFFIQLLGLGLFTYISKTMIGFSDLSALAVFYPVGILTTALPLAPGGIGVGHVAFDRLFGSIGIHGGANVFNVYCLGQLAFNLMGFIPYLFVKKNIQVSNSPIPEFSQT